MPNKMLSQVIGGGVAVRGNAAGKKDSSVIQLVRQRKGSVHGEGKEDVVAVLTPSGTPLSIRRLIQDTIKEYVTYPPAQIATAAVAKSVVGAAIADTNRPKSLNTHLVVQNGKTVHCSVCHIGKHYLIRTDHGEQAILDSGYAAWRLLLLLANIDMTIPLANVFHADKKGAPFIVIGQTVRRETGLDPDGVGTLSYKIPAIRNDRYLREVGNKLLENRCEQQEAKKLGDEAALTKLQEEEDHFLAALRKIADKVQVSTKDAAGGSHTVSKDIHALYMSVMRAIGCIKESAPRLAQHLKQRVKANGTICYQKTAGWDWQFLFPLERVNLMAGDPCNDEEDNSGHSAGFSL